MTITTIHLTDYLIDTAYRPQLIGLDLSAEDKEALIEELKDKAARRRTQNRKG